jgi:hypothetical protein
MDHLKPGLGCLASLRPARGYMSTHLTERGLKRRSPRKTEKRQASSRMQRFEDHLYSKTDSNHTRWCAYIKSHRFNNREGTGGLLCSWIPFLSSVRGCKPRGGGSLYMLRTATLSRRAAKCEDRLCMQEAASTARPLGCRRDAVHLCLELFTAGMGNLWWSECITEKGGCTEVSCRESQAGGVV